MARLTAPKIDRLLRCFEDDYLNPTFMTPKLAAAMEPLFYLMNDLAPLNKNHEAKSIWLQIPRGDISTCEILLLIFPFLNGLLLKK